LNEMIVNWAAGDGIIDTLEWAQDQGMHGWWCWIVQVGCNRRSLTCVAMAPRGWSYLGQSCHLLCWGTWVWLCCRMG
jgi:hypothetical protein